MSVPLFPVDLTTLSVEVIQFRAALVGVGKQTCPIPAGGRLSIRGTMGKPPTEDHESATAAGAIPQVLPAEGQR